MKVDYKRAVKKQQKANAKTVQSPSPTVKIREKIKREAERIGSSERALTNLYKQYPTIRKMLAPKANRQSIHENTFWIALQTHLGKENVEKLENTSRKKKKSIKSLIIL